MYKKTGISTMFFLMCSVTIFAQNREGKKLIEFGWDYPTSSFIKVHIQQMQTQPFDGVVFSFNSGIYNAFDTSSLNDSSFDFEILSKINWQNLSDNFLFMRGASYSGPHWLEDKAWNQISKNLIKVSKALAVSGAKGVAFDPEYYYKDPNLNPWLYNSAIYKNLSYEEAGKYVRKRGKQFIQALQTFKPDIKILCFWLLGLVYDQSLHTPVSQTSMALYPFFIEGMLEGKNKSTEIIDGNESSYWYQKVENFLTSRQLIRQKEDLLINENLRQEYENVSIAQSVYYDGLFSLLPKFNRGFDKATKERWLKNNLYFAFKTSDEYIWFYSERINWWKNRGITELSQLVYDVKNKVNIESKKNNSIKKGRSYLPNFKETRPSGYHSFSYTFRPKSNTIEVKLLKDDIQYLQIYENSKLLIEIKNPSSEIERNLNGKYSKKGNLILLANSRAGITSVAFVN